MRYYTTGEAGARGDVIIGGPGGFARHTWSELPQSRWVGQSITVLNESKWELLGSATTLADVLADVTSLEIRAEYGFGEDETGLDNVALIPLDNDVYGVPRAPIVKVNDVAVTGPKKLDDFDTVVMEVEDVLFPPVVDIQCGADDDDIFATAILSNMIVDDDEGLDKRTKAALLAPWSRLCLNDDRASTDRVLPITLEEGGVYFPARAPNGSLEIATEHLTALVGAAGSVVVRHNPDASLSSLAVLGGRADVSFPSGEQQAMTLEQGAALLVDKDGPQPTMSLPQVFLPTIR